MDVTLSNNSNTAEDPTVARLRVFVSYAWEDRQPVCRLCGRLAKEGFAVWLDRKNILPGQPWDDAILAGLRTVDAFVTCISQSSVTKEGYINKEIALAVEIA